MTDSADTAPRADPAAAPATDPGSTPAAIGIQLTFDASDPHRLAAFWAAALGYQVEDVEALCRRMLEAGYASQDDVEEAEGRLRWRDGTALSPAVPPRDGEPARPRIYVQRVPEGKTAKNRLHLDLHVGADQVAAEVARLERLGARRLYDGEQGPQRWVTMADPEGNEFCLA